MSTKASQEVGFFSVSGSLLLQLLWFSSLTNCVADAILTNVLERHTFISSSSISDAHNRVCKHIYQYMYSLSLWFLNGLSAKVMGQPLDPVKGSLATCTSDCKVLSA